MNGSGIEQIEGVRKQIVLAAENARWDEAAENLCGILWSLAEVRPDFEKLPSWIADARADGVPGGGIRQGIEAFEKLYGILGPLVGSYGDNADRSAVAQSLAQLVNGRSDIPIAERAQFAVDVIGRAARFNNGVRRLPLAIYNDQIFIGRHTRISFNRTLRVPEDGREYPLPAGFGRLPILRVEDYANRVPEKWIDQGGFIIPLYQREALFLEFAGVRWRPTIGKVSVGCINAISGKAHDMKIRPHRQDYVVIPDQHWLDGINAGDGSVSQFVAMPLGKGYTIEAQITDEEKHGGFQLAIFDPRCGRFQEHDPKERTVALETRKQRAFRAAQQQVLKQLPSIFTVVVRALQEQHYRDAASALGMSESAILEIIESARQQLMHSLGANGFDGVIPTANLSVPKVESSLGVQDMPSRAMFMPAVGMMRPTPGESLSQSAAESALEMGIGRGGMIKQQIMEDTYGAESWDEAAFREIVVHIVNSEIYQHITGREAPPSPISAEHYRSYNIPWYSDYQEMAPSLSPVAVFKRILSIGQIDRSRGITAEDALPPREIQAEEILRIHTPSLEERWKDLLDRAAESSKNGHHRIAAREASLALDLSDKHPLPYFIRAFSNHQLGHHVDAEADASACLKLQPDHIGALSVRAYSSLELGEFLLAKNDAETILSSQPDDYDGLYVRAEAHLRLAHYKEAVGDAEMILRRNPANRSVLRIRKTAMTKLDEEKQVPQMAGSSLGSSVPQPKVQGGFKTLEQLLIETKPPPLCDQAMESRPFWIAVRSAAKRALREQSQSVPFFQYYITFFREASLLEIPLERGWDSEWLALILESAFGFANANQEGAEKLMLKVGASSAWSVQIMDALNRSELHWPAHDYVRRVVDDWLSGHHQELASVRGETAWLLECAERFFSAGIYLATEARHDPNALELLEFLDIAAARQWGDSRLHIATLRATPLCCDASIKGTFEHPLLRVAAEKYRDNPIERRIMGKFLEELCIKRGIESEREGLDRELVVCQWVEEGLRFGKQLMQNEPNTFAEMLQAANEGAGDALLAFYGRTLAKVVDRTNPLLVSRAFLEWQAEERDGASPRYFGERLEILLNCTDAAVYLPWAETARNGKLNFPEAGSRDE
jgi:tetratricopeptide (TPR) repeat protein